MSISTVEAARERLQRFEERSTVFMQEHGTSHAVNMPVTREDIGAMRLVEAALETHEENDFMAGALAALGCVYAFDAETIAQEIVKTVGPSLLLSVAVANDDPYLPNLLRTVRLLKEEQT